MKVKELQNILDGVPDDANVYIDVMSAGDTHNSVVIDSHEIERTDVHHYGNTTNPAVTIVVRK